MKVLMFKIKLSTLKLYICLDEDLENLNLSRIYIYIIKRIVIESSIQAESCHFC